MIQKHDNICVPVSLDAQSPELEALREIVSRTGYFRAFNGFYHYDPAGGISGNRVAHVSCHAGYSFPFMSEPKYYCLMLTDLRGLESITKERFEQAARDYKAIKEMLEEAVKP